MKNSDKVKLYCELRGHRLVSRKTVAHFHWLQSEYMRCVRCHNDFYHITENENV